MAPGTGKFAARRVLADLDLSRVPGAQNARIAVLNGGFPGRIQKLPKSEDPYGIRIRCLLMKKHFWVSGTINGPEIRIKFIGSNSTFKWQLNEI
jgi:hypothetical protein